LDHVFPILDISIRSGDMCNHSLTFSESMSNYAHFWSQIFFWGGSVERAPKFLDLDYKIKHTSDDVEKFHGDQTREVRDLLAR